jgi:hypothetical protein
MDGPLIQMLPDVECYQDISSAIQEFLTIHDLLASGPRDFPTRMEGGQFEVEAY